MAVVSTVVSGIYQVEVAQESDFFSNGEPINLYSVFHHGYPLYWAISTKSIPLGELDPQLYRPPFTGVSAMPFFLPVLRNFLLDTFFYLGIYALVAALVVIVRLRKNWRIKGATSGFRPQT